ncbi:MAG: hypothetical protein M3Y38_07770 [Actinomycetota bacterium]|nr:hypothetical protein [Actinomycetota bacterium]
MEFEQRVVVAVEDEGEVRLQLEAGFPDGLEGEDEAREDGVAGFVDVDFALLRESFTPPLYFSLGSPRTTKSGAA